MKQANRLDPLGRSPDPDDLSGEAPPESFSQRPRSAEVGNLRPNPDISEPHVPPPDDHPLRRRPVIPESA